MAKIKGVKRNVLQQNGFYELGSNPVLVFHFLLGHSVPTGETYEYRGNIFNKLEVNMEQIGTLETICNNTRQDKKTGKYKTNIGTLNMTRRAYHEAVNKLTEPIELLWTDKKGNKKKIKQPLLKRKYTKEEDKKRYWTDFKIIPLEQFPPFALIDNDMLAFLLKFKNPWVVNTYAGLLNIKGLGTNKKELERLNENNSKYYGGNPIITCPGNILAYGLKIKKVKQREVGYVKDALITLHEAGIIYLEDITDQFITEDGKPHNTKNSRYIVSKIKRTLDKVQKQQLRDEQIYELEEEVEKLGSEVVDSDFVDPELF